MSTNSGIGYLKSNGKIEGIYCHWDGYLENNGEILYNNWSGTRAVKELVSRGDLSSLNNLEFFADRGEPWKDVAPQEFTPEEFADFQEYNYVWVPAVRKWFVACSASHYTYVSLADAFGGKFGKTVDITNLGRKPTPKATPKPVSEPEVSGGMNPSQQEIEDFFTGASTMINRRRILAADEPEDFEDPRIDEADELQTRVEDDFEYVMTGIERLGREGMLDEAIELLHTLADTLDSAVNIIGDDFESGSEIPPDEEI